MSDQEFLDKLGSELWEHHRDSGPYGSYSTEKRLMTQEELDRILDIASRNIVTLHNASMGFSIGMRIAQEPEAPSYPGVTTDPPKMLCFITSKHLPGVPDGGHQHFAKGWDLFSAIALKPENIAKCKEYKLEVPRNDEGYYDY